MPFINIVKGLLKIIWTLLILSFNAFLYHQAYDSLVNGSAWLNYNQATSQAPIISVKPSLRLNPLQVEVYETSDLGFVLQKYRVDEQKLMQGSQNLTGVNLTALDLNFIQLAQEYHDFIQLSKDIKGLKAQLVNSSKAHQLVQHKYAEDQHHISNYEKQKKGLSTQKEELLAKKEELLRKISSHRKADTKPQTSPSAHNDSKNASSKIECDIIRANIKKLDEENEKFELQHEELKRERFRLNSLKDQLANEQRVLKLQINNRREKITVVLPGDLTNVHQLQKMLKETNKDTDEMALLIDKAIGFMRPKYSLLEGHQVKNFTEKDLKELELLGKWIETLKLQVKKLVKFKVLVQEEHAGFLNDLASRKDTQTLSTEIESLEEEVEKTELELENLNARLKDSEEQLSEVSQNMTRTEARLEDFGNERKAIQNELQAKCPEDAPQTIDEKQSQQQENAEAGSKDQDDVSLIENEIESYEISIQQIERELSALDREVSERKRDLDSLGQNFTERFSEVELNFIKKLLQAKEALCHLRLTKNETKVLLQNV